MKVIIAEKPSLGRNIAEAIGNMKKGTGCMIGDEYIVTWAFGHLFTLCDVEQYTGAEPKSRWTMDSLPCFPDKYMFELKRSDKDGSIDAGVEKQFNIIRSLCLREDVDTIINAGDSDREGEIIVRIIIDNALTPDEKKQKHIMRLWLPDQTPETIKSALLSDEEDVNYDGLAYEGYARMFTDWLYGVNLTRYASLKTGTLLRVGRVIVPIVKAIYDRDKAIEKFVPEKYYGIQSDLNGVELVSKRKFPFDRLDEAQKMCDRYNSLGGKVLSVSRKKDKLNPGKLYSLTKLQNALSKKYKMSMTDSLAILQKLYEEGYVTYPRTNSEYLATAEKEKIGNIIGKVAEAGYPVVFKDGKSIFDDSKIESHSALTPTTKIPPKGKLSEDEAKVYGMIIRRFTAVFCSQDCIINKTEIVIEAGEDEDGKPEQFSLKGTVIVEPGWTKYDGYTGKDKVLPDLKKGDHVDVDFKPVEKTTQPPKHYTVETLNNYLKNPFREELAKARKEKQNKEENEGVEDDTDDYIAVFEGLELGTEATRTGIIDNARKSRYIALNKDVYTIQKEGEFLIESLARMGIDMDKNKTAEIGRALKKVFKREFTIRQSLYVAQKEISEIFGKYKNSPDDTDGLYGDIVGKCPLCGRDVKRSRYGYQCSGYKEGCKFRIRFDICGRTISVADVKKLLTDGITDKIDGFVSKNGKQFSCRLVLKDQDISFDFSNPVSVSSGTDTEPSAQGAVAEN